MSDLMHHVGTHASRRHLSIVTVERPYSDAAPRIAITVTGSSGTRRVEVHPSMLQTIERACAVMRRQLAERDEPRARDGLTEGADP